MEQQQEFTAIIENKDTDGFIKIKYNDDKHYTVGCKGNIFTDLIIVDNYIIASCDNGFIYCISNTCKFISDEGCHFYENDVPYPSKLELSDDKKKYNF